MSDDDVLKTSMHHAGSGGLRGLVAAAISGVDDWRGVTDPAILADAVMELITVHVPPIFASAIHAYADAELTAMNYHGNPAGLAAMKKLNREAAQIANYATMHERWNGGQLA